MENLIDQVKPQGKWAFDGEVTAAFDNMLARSIPQYEVMRDACFNIGSSFVTRDTDVVDLGCSRGEALAPFVDKFGAANRFVGIDVSEPMLTAARKRFRGYPESIVSIQNHDLRTGYPACAASLTLAVLVIQFTPIEHRQRILRDIYNHTRPGGALIIVEKVLGSDAEADGLLVKNYYDMKRFNGYTQEQIDRKRLSLEGVLVPVTAAWNEQILHSAGFDTVECFWRYLNFAGWIAIKE